MSRPLPPDSSEDAVLASFVALGRAYATARKEMDLVEAFLEHTGKLFPEAVISVRVCDLTSHDVRAYVSGGRHPRGHVARVDAAALAGSAPEGGTHEGFAPRSGFEPDTEDAKHGVDIPVFVETTLVVVVSVAYASEPPSNTTRARLMRFGEQLAEGTIGLTERGETARLRLYAGSIVDRTNVPIAVMASNGQVRLSNEALRSTLGMTSRELHAGSLLERIDPTDRRRTLAAHTRAFRGTSSVGVEVSIRGNHDAECRMLVDFEPIPSPGGAIESVLVVGRDVTRVRQLEDQVTHADRLATLGQLAAGVVHELNNPLTSILVYTEYVLRKAESRPASDGDVDKLKRVLGAAERIQEFARNLVAYARSERGEREMLSITQVLDQAVAFCEPIVDRERVTVTRAYQDDVPLLAAVRGQLQQVFINLLTNACHAVPSPGGRVHVSVTSPRPSWVEVRVEDNGPGVDLSRRSEVFRPFVTTKPSGQGTGLGLSIVRNLTERHGGTVEIRLS